MRLGSLTLILRIKRRVSYAIEAPWFNPPKKFERVSSAGKVMASIFWYSQGVIVGDYLERGCTINGAYYAEELRRLHREIVKKKKVDSMHPIPLSEDNAPVHTSQVAMTAVTKCSFEVLLQFSYFLDLALLDFYRFPNLKRNLHSRNFGSNEGAIDFVDEYLGTRKASILKDKPNRTAFEKVHRSKGRLFGEITAQFLLLVIPNVEGPRTFCSSFIHTAEQPLQTISFAVDNAQSAELPQISCFGSKYF